MWLVPFKGRNYSGCYKQNFLWNKDNVYIMDNHRAALWCWFQHISKNEKIDFIHIDKHTDTLQSKLDEWIVVCPDLWSIKLDDYLSFIHKHIDIPLFSWDNYGSIFLGKYGHLVNRCIFATHKVGDKPNFESTEQTNVWNVPGNLNDWIEGSRNKWIVNLDLDYFFYECDSETYSIFLSDNYIEQIFNSIKKQLVDGKILCFTMCLSPECCGGWKAAEEICRKATNILEIDFKLPR
jgi:hypothetical protein